MWRVRNDVDITLMFTRKMYGLANKIYNYIELMTQRQAKVNAKKFMISRCHITCSRNTFNGTLYITNCNRFIAKMSKLNLKGLSTAKKKKKKNKKKKTVHWVQLHLFLEKQYNSNSHHQDHQNLSNHQCIWTTLNSLELLFCQKDHHKKFNVTEVLDFIFQLIYNFMVKTLLWMDIIIIFLRSSFLFDLVIQHRKSHSFTITDLSVSDRFCL